MEMRMKIIIITLSVALLMLVNEASAQSAYSVSVSRHADIPELNEKRINQILEDASKTLRKDSVDNGDADVACDVAFTLKGPVRTFGSVDTPADIVNEQHRDAVHEVDSDIADVDFHIKVVNNIKFCRPGAGLFNGCAFPVRFRSIIVVLPRDDFPDHLLWAHEFGHLTGLPHRHSKCALMTSCGVAALASVARVRINREECGCLRGGPGFCGPPDRVDCGPDAGCQ
jgi:hypothetical protein